MSRKGALDIRVWGIFGVLAVLALIGYGLISTGTKPEFGETLINNVVTIVLILVALTFIVKIVPRII